MKIAELLEEIKSECAKNDLIGENATLCIQRLTVETQTDSDGDILSTDNTVKISAVIAPVVRNYLY